jgi:serine/threonine protein kinase
VPGFDILEEINRGGMGVIFKARQLGLNRIVALKVLSPDHTRHPEALRRFQREVQAAALLSHPNIVTVYHTDLEGPLPYLAMEYVPGIDLFRLVAEVGPLPVSDACLYIRQAALGLQHAFEQGLVHRDIKPANLMVTPSPLETSHPQTSRVPRIKILDMGLARVTVTPEGVEVASNLTQAGEFLGTPDFIAPEQAEDPRNADTRSDLYSLGGTLYYLLIGEAPFPATNVMQKLRRMLSEPPPSPAARRPDVPLALDALVRRLMSRDPAARCQTPAEVVETLDVILRQPNAPPVSPTPAAQPATPGLAASPSSHTAPDQIRAHAGGVQSLCLSADGQVLLSGGLDEALRVWDARRLREMRSFTVDVGPINQVAMVSSGKWAASCSSQLFQQNMVVPLWDLVAGVERRRLRGPTDQINCVAITPDGRRIAAGSDDRTVWVWTLEPAAVPALTLKGHTDLVSSVLFVPGGESLLSAGHDGTLRQWDLKSGSVKGMIDPHVGRVNAVAFGGPSRRLAIAGTAGLVLRLANGTLLELNGHQGPVLCVAFASDGQLLVSGGQDNTVRIWRASDGELLNTLEGHSASVTGVAIMPDARTVYSGSADCTIRRWPLSA